jgi:hypothetical protein
MDGMERDGRKAGCGGAECNDSMGWADEWENKSSFLYNKMHLFQTFLESNR